MYIFSNKVANRTYCVYSPLVDAELRLALLSDLHSNITDKNLALVKNSLAEASPHAVMLLGDILDKRLDFKANALELLNWLGKNYRCFYVSGNHEARDSNRLSAAVGVIEAAGINALDGRRAFLHADGLTKPVKIFGIASPVLYGGFEEFFDAMKAVVSDRDALSGDGDCFRLLLAHHPEHHDAYKKCGFNLILSGHAHGGQVRIPGVLNGLYAPGEGFFPGYAGGKYELDEHCTLIVSRGLCVNALPRIFNRPEIVYVDIKPAAIHKSI